VVYSVANPRRSLIFCWDWQRKRMVPPAIPMDYKISTDPQDDMMDPRHGSNLVKGQTAGRQGRTRPCLNRSCDYGTGRKVPCRAAVGLVGGEGHCAKKGDAGHNRLEPIGLSYVTPPEQLVVLPSSPPSCFAPAACPTSAGALSCQIESGRHNFHKKRLL
jgi:hypothetical protein